MKLSEIKNILLNNKSLIKDKDLYFNSNKLSFGAFIKTVESIEPDTDFMYKLELCSSDYPASWGNLKRIEVHLKNFRFSQVKLYASRIPKNVTTEASFEAIEEFGINK